MASPGLSRRLRSRPKEGHKGTSCCASIGIAVDQVVPASVERITDAVSVEPLPHFEPTMGHFPPEGTAWYNDPLWYDGYQIDGGVRSGRGCRD